MTHDEDPVQTLARIMFHAYNNYGPNPWKTWDGKDVPQWDELGPHVRGKWVAAATAALKEFTS